MGQGSPAASTVEWFTDGRTPARRMKASWHGEAGVVVLSLWQDDICTGTFRLPIAAAPGLIQLLVEALGDALADAPRPDEPRPDEPRPDEPPPAPTSLVGRIRGLWRRPHPLAAVIRIHP